MEHNESKYSLIAAYYAEHYDEIMSFVASRLLQSAETEDIVQNVFLRLLQIDKMITPTTLPCLVYTVARNLVIDYWRRKKCWEEYEHFICKGDWQTQYVDDVESVYSAREVEMFLEKSMARLSDKQSRVIRMNIFEGMQVGEIAQVLDINYKIAEYRLGAARKAVRNYMSKVYAV